MKNLKVCISDQIQMNPGRECSDGLKWTLTVAGFNEKMRRSKTELSRLVGKVSGSAKMAPRCSEGVTLKSSTVTPKTYQCGLCISTERPGMLGIVLPLQHSYSVIWESPLEEEGVCVSECTVCMYNCVFL